MSREHQRFFEVSFSNEDFVREPTGTRRLAYTRLIPRICIMKRHIRVRPAFSLLELLAVVTILGIIAAMVLPRVVVSNDKTKEATCHHSRGQINTAVEQYYIHTGAWPANDLSDIAADLNYFPSGIPTCPVTGEAYRLDPTMHRVVGHTGAGAHSP
jgi:general secretion pathway protein G